MPFLGHYEHSLDTKGRVSIPAAYRDELARQEASSIIISPYSGAEAPVLWVFSPWAWNQIVKARIGNRDPFDQQVLAWKRAVVQKSAPCSLDGNGRILIPPELRTFAGLERDVVLAGMEDWFEIWQAEQYRRVTGSQIEPKLWEQL